MPNLNKSFQWWINTCNAPRIAYSQRYRNQVYLPNYDVTCYDCSSFIWYGLLDGGFDCVGANNGDSWPFWTGSMAEVLIRLGFTQLRASGTAPMKGDILWRTGHTEAVYDIDQSNPRILQSMGAHNYGPPVHPDLGNTPLPDQVSINGWFDSVGEWDLIYRLGAGGVTGFGSSLYVIAALCGNLWQESTINPALHQQGSGTAYGLFQWDGSRKTALLNWLSQNGYSADSAEGQIAYFIHEDFWSAKPISTSNGIHNLTEFLQSSITDIDLLTEIFCDCWEIAGTPMMANRKRYARECYDYIMQNGNTGSINEWKVNLTGYLVPEDSFNNAVMFYRNFSAGGGGGWPFGMPPRYPHKMPVWMMTRKIYC